MRRILTTITPATLPVKGSRYTPRCVHCPWGNHVEVKYAESLNEIAGDHVRQTGHSVAIEEIEAA